MPAWDQIVSEFGAIPPDQQAPWMQNKLVGSLQEVGKLRGGRHVILYASAFLQKPQAPPPNTQVTHEDLNGFMSSIYGMNCKQGVTILIHSPGGVTTAAETIVAYLRSKFTDVEVIVPAIAMSAATMITLSADRLVMGRQSQIGPIDPHFIVGRASVSARSIVDQFARAKRDIKSDLSNAHLWAPLLGSIGPAMLQEAYNALDYGERMVAQWLERYMFKDQPKRRARTWAKSAAKHFNDASKHKSHGRRIDRDEARTKHIVVEDLEANQELQEATLTGYHLMTILFEKSQASKILVADTGKLWIKNWAPMDAPFVQRVSEMERQ